MRIAIYYTHSETLGHTTRVMRIAQHLKSKGHRVLVLQGGIPQPFLRFPGIEKVDVPHPLFGRDRFFSESTKLLDRSQIGRRRRIIKETVFSFKPDILFTEYFPFGRLEGEYELFPVLNLVKKRLGGTRIYASIGYPIFGSIMSRKVERFSGVYDKIFIHAPELEKGYAKKSFPDTEAYERVFDSIDDKVIFTGYITRKRRGRRFEREERIRNIGKRKLVVVSRGGGVFYPKMIASSLALAKKLDDYYFFVSAGPATTEKQWRAFERIAKRTDNVELRRYVPNLDEFIRSSDLSVSMSGYNTSVELMLGKARSITMPLLMDPEQVYRAKILKDIMNASVIGYDNLSLRVLLESMELQMKSTFKPKVRNEWFNGLQTLEKNL